MGSAVSFVGMYMVGMPTAVILTFYFDFGVKGISADHVSSHILFIMIFLQYSPCSSEQVCGKIFRFFSHVVHRLFLKKYSGSFQTFRLFTLLLSLIVRFVDRARDRINTGDSHVALPAGAD